MRIGNWGVGAGEEWEGLPTSEREDVCQRWGPGSNLCDVVANVQGRVHIWLVVYLCSPGKDTYPL